jgi:cell growth-regulating nucleolar protein
MVFFVCNGCNESLKKNQVDNHAHRCSSCYAVTCIDCNVSFPDDEYRAHTSCVSEKERYEGSTFRGVRKGEEGKSNKKMTPQEQWNLVIRTAGDRASSDTTMDSNLKSYMVTLGACDNVPRKQKQFVNFCDNSLKIRNNAALVDRIWKCVDNVRQEFVKAKEEKDAKDKERRDEDKERREANSSANVANKRKAEVVEEETPASASAASTAAAADNDNDTASNGSDISTKTLLKHTIKALKKADGKAMKLKELLPAVMKRLEEKGVVVDEKVCKKGLKGLEGEEGVTVEGKVYSIV